MIHEQGHMFNFVSVRNCRKPFRRLIPEVYLVTPIVLIELGLSGLAESMALERRIYVDVLDLVIIEAFNSAANRTVHRVDLLHQGDVRLKCAFRAASLGSVRTNSSKSARIGFTTF